MPLTGASAVKSSVYKRQQNSDATRDSLATRELGARQRTCRISHTLATGDGSGTVFGDNDEMNLVEIPAGATIDLKRSYFKASADPGAILGKIGVREFQNPDGTVVAEDPAYVASILNMTGTSLFTLSTTNGNGADNLGLVRLNSKGPVTLFFKAVANGGTVDGDIADVWDWQFTYWTD